MRGFDARLLEGGRVGDATAAMQGAMVSMIRDGHWTVMQWAAFVVYGLASADLAAARTQSPAESTPPRDASVFANQQHQAEFVALLNSAAPPAAAPEP